MSCRSTFEDFVRELHAQAKHSDANPEPRLRLATVRTPAQKTCSLAGKEIIDLTEDEVSVKKRDRAETKRAVCTLADQIKEADSREKKICSSTPQFRLKKEHKTFSSPVIDLSLDTDSGSDHGDTVISPTPAAKAQKGATLKLEPKARSKTISEPSKPSVQSPQIRTLKSTPVQRLRHARPSSITPTKRTKNTEESVESSELEEPGSKDTTSEDDRDQVIEDVSKAMRQANLDDRLASYGVPCEDAVEVHSIIQSIGKKMIYLLHRAPDYLNSYTDVKCPVDLLKYHYSKIKPFVKGNQSRLYAVIKECREWEGMRGKPDGDRCARLCTKLLRYLQAFQLPQVSEEMALVVYYTLVVRTARTVQVLLRVEEGIERK